MGERAWDRRYWFDVRWGAVYIAAIFAIVFSPFLLGERTLLASADTASLYAAGAGSAPLPITPYKAEDPGAAAWQPEPWLQIEHDALFVDHRIPWWDPYDGYGAPFTASQQPAPFYPLTMLASIAPSPWCWNVFVIARLFVAGLFALMFIRLFAGRLAALGSGIAAAFGGYYLLYYGLPELSVAVLFPALFWGTEWVVRRPGPGSIAALGAATALSYLGGMPETAALALLATAAYFFVRIAWDSRELGIRGTVLRAATFAAANALGLATGAVMLLPFAEYLGHALDQHRNAGYNTGNVADHVSLLRAALQRIAPLAYGPPWNSIAQGAENGWAGLRGWFGAVVAFGASIAVFASVTPEGRRNARVVLPLGLLIALALAKEVGAPWIEWTGSLPMLRLINFPKYAELLVDVPAALLCGFGIAAYENGRAPSAWVPAAAAATVAAMLTFGVVDAQRTLAPAAQSAYLYGSAAFAAAMLLAAAWVANERRLAPHAALVLSVFVGIEAVGSYYVPMFGVISPPVSSYLNPYSGAAYVSTLHSLNTTGLRVYALDGLLEPNWAGAMRIDSPTALNAMYPEDFLPFIRAFIGQEKGAADQLHDRFNGSLNPALTTPGAERWLTLSSVGFVAVPAATSIASPHLHEVWTSDVRIYAYDDALPRASIFHSARFVPDENTALRMVRAPATDVHRTVVLVRPDDTPSETSSPSASAAPQTEVARITRRDGSNVTIDASLGRPGYVMLNDTFYPGWIATVDGVPTPILRADYLFRAVRVGAGAHTVQFAYRSGTVTLGIVLSLLGLLAIVACASIAYAGRSRLIEDRSR